MTVYLCDPRWHSGNRTAVARYLVRAAGPQHSPMAPSFACCGTHLGRAVTHMMATYGWRSVEVRDVSGRVPDPAPAAEPGG